MDWKKITVAAILFVGFAALIARLLYHPTLHTEVTIGTGTKVTVEVAATPAEQVRGLSYRDSLAPDAGMLFVFDTPEIQYFWMHEMRFPLDVVWIKGDRVVSLSENVQKPTESDTPRMNSRVPADRVLEVNAGFIKAHGVAVGDAVSVIQGR